MQRLVAQQLETMMESRTAESYAEEAAELRRNLRDARAERDVLRRDAERYRWLCTELGETNLPVLIERITSRYVADYKPSIDAAIDAAMQA